VVVIMRIHLGGRFFQLVSNGRVYIGVILHQEHYLFSSYWTVFISTRMPWSVFPEALKTRPAGCGAMFTTKHP
jgi:hypothetical protein